MTYQELLNWAEERGYNLAYLSLGRMMDEVERETGEFPSWTHTAPQWVVDKIKH